MPVVKIKRIRTNFQVRFGYDEELIKHLKTISKEQIKTTFDTVITDSGQSKKDWFHICNIHGLMKIMWYCQDNHILYQYENLSEKEIWKVEEYVKKRKERLIQVEKFKNGEFDEEIKNEDYSFMKIEPHLYQKKAVKFFECSDGVALLGDEPGVGKAQNLNSLIATPNGWEKFGDLKYGQEVFGSNGNVYSITGIFPQGKQKTYRVFFNDGFFAECNIDHLWIVRDGNRRLKNGGWTVKSLKEIMTFGLKYKSNKKREKSNRKAILKWEIPIAKPCAYPKKEFIINPYILGALIGDGCLCGEVVCISIPDFQFEIKERIDSLLPLNLKTRGNRYPNCPQYYITQRGTECRNKRNPFKSEIRRLKLNVKSGQKFIPKEYLYSDIDQRIDLLRGLMDTDGSALKNRINFHTTSKQLSDDVAELVQSLGGQAIVNIIDRRKENKSIEYRVNIRVDFCPFYLKQKVEQWSKRTRNYASRYFEKIEYVGEEEHVCISVNSPDNSYLTNNYIVTHNTLTAISYSAKHHFQTLIICPASLALIWAKEILKFTNEVPYVFKYKTKKKEGLQLGSPETSKIHIVSYNALETYLKFDVHHKCQNPYCDFDEVSQVKKHKMCPKCFKENSVKSRNTELCSFVDKGGVDLKTSIYDLIVIDECHYIKNVKSSRYKLVNAGFKKTPRKILMSGTAIKNKPYEFFPVLNFLDPFEWVNSHSFGVKYCGGKEDEWGHWNYDDSTNEAELFQKLSYLYLRRRKKDPGVLEYLPAKTYTIIPIHLTPEELRDYKKLEKGVVEDTSEDDDRMVGLAKIQKLKMFTSKICAQRSFEFIRNIIDGDEKVVVFSQYVETTRMIYEEFKDNAVWYTGKKSAEEKEEAREGFMEDEKIKVFSGTIGAAGVGLTLTSASTVLFIDQPWTPSDRIQAEDRCHRAGQESDKVQIIRLIVQDTIDEYIEDLLNRKEKITMQILDGEHRENSVKHSVFDDLLQIVLSKKKSL